MEIELKSPSPENFLKGKKIITKCTNFVAFCEDNDDDNVKTNPTRYITYDYHKKLWYEYKDSGPASCPVEIFVGWIDPALT